MKKIFRLLIVLVISISLVASFAFAAKAEKVKVTFWTWMTNPAPIEQFNNMQDEIEVVQVLTSHADIRQKLTIALAANKGAADIFQMTQRHFSYYSTTGKLYDMTADVSDVIGKFPESMQEIVSFKGKVYGLATDISPAVLWYRKDIFEENGIGKLDTWSQFEEAAAKLKGKGIYMIPIFNPAGAWGANAIAMFLGSRGGNIYTAEGKVIKNNADLEFVLNWFYDMAKNGYGESLTFYTPEFWGEFKSGKIAAWPMNMAEGGNIKRNMPELEGKWGVMPFPKWDDKSEQLTGIWGGSVFAIPDQSPNKAKSVEFVKWAASTVEGQVALSREWNLCPAIPEAYSNEFYSKGDPFLGGDNAFTMINDTTPFYFYDWSTAEMVMGEQIDLMFAGKITPTQARQAIEDNISKQTGR